MNVRTLAVLVVVAACRAEPVPEPEARLSPPAEAPTLITPPSERHAGGRPLSWWRGYLKQLRASGPPPLFDLAVQRARANGLVVKVTDTAVSVDAPQEKGGAR